MRRSLRNLTLLLSTLVASCGPSHQVTSSWMSPEARSAQKKYSTIYVEVLTQNQSAKNTIEEDMAKEVRARGYKAIKSSEVFSPAFRKGAADTSEVIAKAKELGCDIILTSALVDKQSESRYVPGTVAYTPYWGYRGRGLGGYYGYMYPTVYGSPGYYTEEKKYFIETNLFDVGTGLMIYSVQSTAYDPSTITAFSRDYSNAITRQFTKDLHAR